MLLQNLILLLTVLSFVAASSIPGQDETAINFPETERELKKYMETNKLPKLTSPQIKAIPGYSSLPRELKEIREKLNDPSKQQEQFKILEKYREKIKKAYESGKPKDIKAYKTIFEKLFDIKGTDEDTKDGALLHKQDDLYNNVFRYLDFPAGYLGTVKGKKPNEGYIYSSYYLLPSNYPVPPRGN